MKYNRVSADCHMDLCWIPTDLFTTEGPATLKGRLPYTVDGPNGQTWTTDKGAPLGLARGVGVIGKKYTPGAHHRFDVMSTTGIYADGERGVNRVGDPDARIKEMERDGVDAEVIFGILAVSTTLNDPEAAFQMSVIYNNWMADFCSHYPDRQIGLASIPVDDMDQAVAEVRRVAKLGMKGIEIPCQWNTTPFWDPHWEPLWNAISEVDLPVHFHAFPVMAPGVLENAGKLRPNATFVAQSLFQSNLYNLVASLIGGGVLERHPTMRVGLGESGIGWLPYALDRMDFLFDDQKQFRDMGVRLKPSEYWSRQCKASFQYERIGAKLVDMIGVESLMWGSDFPHGDGVWPESSKYIDEQFSYLPAADARKITCDNAVAFYRLPQAAGAALSERAPVAAE